MEEEDKTREKRVGYAIIIILLILFGGVSLRLAFHFLAPRREIVVYLPKIGELKKEQPLMNQGYKVGEVTGFSENVYEGVAVTIRLTRPIKIRKGYSFYAEDIDLFGYSKRVVLENGPESAPEVPEEKRLYGSYYPGIPEILAAIKKFESAMITVSKSLEAYMEGDPQAIRILTAFDLVQNNSEHIITTLSAIDSFLSGDFQEVITLLDDTKGASGNLSRTVASKLPIIRDKAETAIEAIDSTFQTIPSIIETTEKYIDLLAKFEETDKSQKIILQLKEISKDLTAAKENAHRLRLLLRKYSD